MTIKKIKILGLFVLIAGLLVAISACSTGSSGPGDIINDINGPGDDDAVWNTLSTDSFSLKHPAGWEKDEYEYILGIGDLGWETGMFYDFYSQGTNKYFLLVYMEDYLEGYSDSARNEILEEERDFGVEVTEDDDGFQFLSKADFEISGQNAYEYKYLNLTDNNWTDNNVERIIMTYYQGDFFYIVFIDDESNYQNSKEIADSMIDSIEFY